jgi:hypothetical protein
VHVPKTLTLSGRGRQRCWRHGVHLFEVDLRWGISRAEAESDRALQLCLEAVDRCRPFFVGMLGQRYGQVPARYRTDGAAALAWLDRVPAGRSVTDLEFSYGALDAVALAGQPVPFPLGSPKQNVQLTKEDAGDAGAVSAVHS